MKLKLLSLFLILGMTASSQVRIDYLRSTKSIYTDGTGRGTIDEITMIKVISELHLVHVTIISDSFRYVCTRDGNRYYENSTVNQYVVDITGEHITVEITNKTDKVRMITIMDKKWRPLVTYLNPNNF